MTSGDAVAVCIVTYNSAVDLPACLAAVAAQDHRPLELVIVDCASSDDSLRVAREAETPGVPKQVVDLKRNLGFAGGMNHAFRLTRAPYVLTLNADAIARPTYVRRLLARIQQAAERTAAVTGRLVRPPESADIAPARLRRDAKCRLDACGMVLTRAWRHLDRGSGEVDRGQWAEPCQVFGATGAATLFAQAALSDVAVQGEVFDPAFHCFREDAELCFRFQERGWWVIYEPLAIAEHRRRVLPERRRQLPAAINYHSLKNRYLLRAYHQTAGNFWRNFLPATFRDLQALIYVLLIERSSLAAYAWLWRHRKTILDHRRYLQARRSEPPAAVDRWFSHHTLPLD